MFGKFSVGYFKGDDIRKGNGKSSHMFVVAHLIYSIDAGL